MAKKIIILTRNNPWPQEIGITYAMWADVPLARQSKYVKPNDWLSAYDGADAGELTLLRSGAVTEKVESTNVPVGTNTATIKNIIEAAFTRFQNEVTNEASWQFYGTFFDGTIWTNGGI